MQAVKLQLNALIYINIEYKYINDLKYIFSKKAWAIDSNQVSIYILKVHTINMHFKPSYKNWQERRKLKTHGIFFLCYNLITVKFCTARSISIC